MVTVHDLCDVSIILKFNMLIIEHKNIINE